MLYDFEVGVTETRQGGKGIPVEPVQVPLPSLFEYYSCTYNAFKYSSTGTVLLVRLGVESTWVDRLSVLSSVATTPQLFAEQPATKRKKGSNNFCSRKGDLQFRWWCLALLLVSALAPWWCSRPSTFSCLRATFRHCTVMPRFCTTLPHSPLYSCSRS